MSIMSYNGGCIIAMSGKDCVAIASDKRFGTQGGHTISSKFTKVFQYGPRLFAGFAGLATDITTVQQRLKFRVNMYELRESRHIKPKTLASLISTFLYERRFGPYFIEPIVAGLDDKTGQPFIESQDCLGSPTTANDFVVAGVCTEQLYGMCETLWEPDLNSEELFEVISQSLLSACDRDAISGWGGTVWLIEKDNITQTEIKGRMD